MTGLRRARWVPVLLLIPLWSARPARAAALPPTASGTVIHLEQADEVEYLEKERRVELRGHVRVTAVGSTILADTIHVDLARNTITAEGHLVWLGEDYHATGTRMVFNLRTRTGEVEDVVLQTGPWWCRGPKVEQPEENTVVVQPGLITTCDAARPHYAIRCRRVRIRLQRDLLATSVTLVVGTTPIFWLPVLATPLHEFRLPFEAQVGRTRALGAFVRASPAYSFHRRAPGQVHADFFERQGWGGGVTQEITASGTGRLLRLHGWGIRERVPLRPDGRRERWELTGDGNLEVPLGARLAVRGDLLSDPQERAEYGLIRLGLPPTAGERRATALLSRGFAQADLAIEAERTETLHVSRSSTGESRYALSTVNAPRVSLTGRPVPLARGLSISAGATAGRNYSWQNGWYVGSVGVTPALELAGRLPGVGAATLTPRLSVLWRDRGDRVLPADPGAALGSAFEDANRGTVVRGETAASLRRGIGLGAEAELTHSLAARLNKIGYDPYSYHGLESHRTGARLSRRFGTSGLAGISTSYDLRNRQDAGLRRWGPVVPELEGAPAPWLAVSGRADYDLALRSWRGAEGSATLGRETPTGSFLRLQPRYTNNRLALPVATTTGRDYRLAQALYGGSFEDAGLGVRRILTLDGSVGFPIGARVRATAAGQWDLAAHRVPWVTATLTRNLHCWELVGSVQRSASGEWRFSAGLGLSAFPSERVPLSLGF